MNRLRSGQLAAAAGVNPQTLRYYERRGLLPEPERSLGGHRLYPTEAVARLRAIKAAQRLGFRLDEVAELVGTTGGFRGRAQRKLTEIETAITDLHATAGVLHAAVEAGCDDLAACAHQPRCPVPFTDPPAEPPRRARPGTVRA